ncbi:MULTISPECIES: transcriptional regulator [Ralstonia solanacearum species complex]|uniref:transcriptional regulator n=1 Tax=Ralstonia solanacearum species complex TaxID=3116862 RepID=UPI001F08DED1|nr:transcriptional regulator [Ralstonia solanacearum]
MKISLWRTQSPDRRHDTSNASADSAGSAAQARPAPGGGLGNLLTRRKRAEMAGEAASAPRHRPLPHAGTQGASLTSKLQNWLGQDSVGLSPLALNRMPDAYAIESAGNATAGATYTYDGLLAHDVLNLVAAGLGVASRSALMERYRTALDVMLQADVATLKRASALNERSRRSGKPSARPADSAERARYPALDAHYRESDASRVENLIVTRDHRGRWQYDSQKLLRIARDDAHPHARHARDVLMLVHVCGQQGMRRRNDAVYQTFLSGLGAGASALMIAGTHGAALPVVAAGYAVAAARELLWLGKPLAEEKQKMRDAKAEQMTRIVNRELKQLDPRGADQDAGTSSTVDPGNLPLEARAGIVAAAFANAEKRVADQNFGKGIPGRWINHRKATAFKDEERSIVVDHALQLIGDELMREATRSADTLTALQAIAQAPDLSLSRRARKLARHVKASPGLLAIHALLTDMGMRKGEALHVLSRLVDVQLARASGGDAIPFLGDDAARIADWIHQPQLKEAPLQVAHATLHGALRRRSERV